MRKILLNLCDKEKISRIFQIKYLVKNLKTSIFEKEKFKTEDKKEEKLTLIFVIWKNPSIYFKTWKILNNKMITKNEIEIQETDPIEQNTQKNKIKVEKERKT